MRVVPSYEVVLGFDGVGDGSGVYRLPVTLPAVPRVGEHVAMVYVDEEGGEETDAFEAEVERVTHYCGSVHEPPYVYVRLDRADATTEEIIQAGFDEILPADYGK